MSWHDVLLGLLLAALAGNQITETVHHGKLFERLQTWADNNREAADRIWFVRWIAQLIACPFCFAHWACGGCVVLWLWVTDAAAPWAYGYFVLLAFAATRLATLINDVAYPVIRMHADEIVDETENVDAVILDDDPPESGEVSD